MVTSMQDFLVFIGRILFSLIFIMAGYDKLIYFNETVAQLANKGIDMPEVWLTLAIVMELGGGLLVLLGLWARLGAFLIFLFVIPVTYVFHSFWGFEPDQMMNQVHHFLKNIAILGGSLFILAHGSGGWSLDRLWKRSE